MPIADGVHPPLGHPDHPDATVDHPDADLIIRGLADGLAINDAEGHYLYVSPAYESLSGYGASDLLGRTPFQLGLIHPDDLEHVIEVQTEALTTRQPVRVVFRFKRSDGAYVWAEAAGGAAETDDGPQFVSVTRKASQLETLTQGMVHERQVKLQLEELAARQQQFLTTVSHRLRTPLTSAVGMVALLRHHGDDLTPENRQALLDRLHANTTRLMVLVEEVTDADRLTREDVVLERRVVNMRALVRTVLENVAGPGAAVEIEVDPDLRAVIDRTKVARMLEILVGNAFEHAGLGAQVKVTARAIDDGVELLVDDDGPGISPAVRGQVFEPFVHAERGRADPGSGLGLYLVSELAGLHRGRVRVEDSPSGGARLRVSLPRPRADAPITTDDDEPDETRHTATALRPEAHRFVTRLLTTLRRRIDMDLVYLSVLDDHHQYVLAAAGTLDQSGIEPGRRIPLEDTYCAPMVSGELNHVVGDTSANPITAGLPVTAAGVACWIGVPVRLPSGQILGTLCCADANPHPDLPPSAAEELRSFAAILGDHLASEGLLDSTSFDATGRIADVLTRPDATYPMFQAIVDLTHGTVAGVEALARFADHDRPTELWFTDAARAGLLVDLEVLAAGQGLTALQQLPDDCYVAINVSPPTIRSRELAALLDGLPLDRIVLEVTEHAAVDNYKPLIAVLGPYRAQGLRVAIDDVGTGYAGLGHLIQLAPDIIKVDRSLVEMLDGDPTHGVAIGGIVPMAEHVGASLVAEGIERPATLTAARDIGFSHAQGYLLARPSSDIDLTAVADNARQLLAQHATYPVPEPAWLLPAIHQPAASRDWT